MVLKRELEKALKRQSAEILDYKEQIKDLQNKIKAYELEKSDGIAWEVTLKRLNEENE